MTVAIEAEGIAEKDFVEGYGTVTAIVKHWDAKKENITSIDFTFFNGTVLTGVDPEAIFDYIGGGLTDHGPIGSIRPGLADDHPK